MNSPPTCTLSMPLENEVVSTLGLQGLPVQQSPNSSRVHDWDWANRHHHTHPCVWSWVNPTWLEVTHCTPFTITHLNMLSLSFPSSSFIFKMPQFPRRSHKKGKRLCYLCHGQFHLQGLNTHVQKCRREDDTEGVSSGNQEEVQLAGASHFNVPSLCKSKHHLSRSQRWRSVIRKPGRRRSPTCRLLWTATLYVDDWLVYLLVWLTDYLWLESWFSLQYDMMTQMWSRTVVLVLPLDWPSAGTTIWGGVTTTRCTWITSLLYLGLRNPMTCLLG